MVHEMAKIKLYMGKTLYRLELEKDHINKTQVNHKIECVNFFRSRTDVSCIYSYLIADTQAFYCTENEDGVEMVHVLNVETNTYEPVRTFEEYKEDGLLEVLTSAYNIKSMMSKLNNSDNMYETLENMSIDKITYSQDSIEETFSMLEYQLAQWYKLFVPYIDDNGKVNAHELTGNNYGYFFKHHVDKRIVPIAVPNGTPIIKLFHPEGLRMDIISKIDNLKNDGAQLFVWEGNKYVEEKSLRANSLEELLKHKQIKDYANNNVHSFVNIDFDKVKIFVEEDEENSNRMW